jgi:hypothetical protein
MKCIKKSALFVLVFTFLLLLSGMVSAEIKPLPLTIEIPKPETPQCRGGKSFAPTFFPQNYKTFPSKL